MAASEKTIVGDILLKIKALDQGSVFTPKDFLDVAKRGMVDVTLKTLLQQGTVRRLARGLYDIPRRSTLLSTELSPDIDAVAKAIARRFRWRIVPSGAHAANLLGISTQVPAKFVYLADGIDRTKTFTVGTRSLVFKASRPRHFGGDDNSISPLVIQALRYLGKDAIDQQVIATLRTRLQTEARQQFLADARYASDWIYGVAKVIAEKAAGSPAGSASNGSAATPSVQPESLPTWKTVAPSNMRKLLPPTNRRDPQNFMTEQMTH